MTSFYYVANEYLHNKIHGIQAVQGRGGINEMKMHIKKTYGNMIRLFTLVGSS